MLKNRSRTLNKKIFETNPFGYFNSINKKFNLNLIQIINKINHINFY